MSECRIEIQKLHPQAVLPRYMTQLAAGMDVCAVLDAPVSLAPGQRRLLSTGLAFAIPEGFEVQVRPRSGLAIKHGIGIVNSPGTIDADYRGEIKIILINFGQEEFIINPGERIAQLVVAPVVRATLAEVDVLSATQRGSGGFGHTGQQG